ncbi:accessory Sec system protein Asp2 [Lactococcus lactis]|uniref:accessory Sec system protein Asp2 n=1 Tax=Lactococcus lactis TaxID=1358 RepID=UPI00111FDAB8|nr:accessory Sec system protein Asp2 [Lactococcus lactis]TNU77505.1 accessory Sec system protein Asp2 [Lactococcus lactis subsp. lactis]
MKKCKVLQVGINDWGEHLLNYHQKNLEWNFLSVDSKVDIDKFIANSALNGQSFDTVICTDVFENNIIIELSEIIEAHTLIIDDLFQLDVVDEIILKKCPIFMRLNNKKVILDEMNRYFFSGQRGGKLQTSSILVNERFKGRITLNGQEHVNLEGHFSKMFKDPLITWKDNIFMNDHSQKIWLEFEHSEGVKITMTIIGYIIGQEENAKIWNYSESEIKRGIEVTHEEGKTAELNFSLYVTGEGYLNIGTLHYRDSRNKYGEFLLGGEKVSDFRNEEIFYYFNPGDLKPPLNIYFSGYRTLEGFEGFYMMKELGAPFLLIADTRLEGGSFYLGSEELEKKLLDIILYHLNKLGFSRNELILSGLSMGTFGALYYAAKLLPHTVIIGKPLANLGTIAENEKLVRPGGFPTSLDILRSLTGTDSKNKIEELNSRFWNVFDNANFFLTQFVISYMKDDDYDQHAYEDLTEHLSNKEVRIIGKGTPGRHNDNWNGIYDWFIGHYKRVLLESFGRKGINEL